MEKYASLLMTESYDACEVACWKAKATNTHTEYEIAIAFSQQQWLRGIASVLRLYAHCLFFIYMFRVVSTINKYYFPK